MNLEAWLSWQIQLHPQAIELGLTRVAKVWAVLGPKQLPFPVITVGGTNGKGSCVAMLEAIALAAGYRCAAYTSPHLLHYCERIRINGLSVPETQLCAAFARVEQARAETPLTYFEFGTLAALDLFMKAQPDLAILEVGLGGRLDAVNILDPDVAIVTSIGHDHTAWLGESLAKIAFEKAGIFRSKRWAVIGQRCAPKVLRQHAQQLGALSMQLGYEFDWKKTSHDWLWRNPEQEQIVLPFPQLCGDFQLDNAASALTALWALRERLPIPHAALIQGLQTITLPGRFQIFPGAITWILDVAHNHEAGQMLAQNIRALHCQGRFRVVFAMLADKDPVATATPLDQLIAHWYLAQSDDPRALPANQLTERLTGKLTGSLETYGSLEDAFTAAQKACMIGDCVLVFGSFTTVASALLKLQS